MSRRDSIYPPTANGLNSDAPEVSPEVADSNDPGDFRGPHA